MGAESKCTLTFGKTKAEGTALLETDALIFRGGDVRLSVPYKTIKSVASKDGDLRVTFPDGVAVFAIGAAAAKWADKIRNPPSRLDKLGVKADHVVIVLGVKDPDFRAELAERTTHVSTRLAGEADIIFLGAERLETVVNTLVSAIRHLRRGGAIWIVRPKGRPEISERDVMQAGKDAGLVDIKVARFSDTHTAEKFVVPVAARR